MIIDPINPKNGLDLIGTFVMGALYGTILYILINVIVQGSYLLMKLLP